MANLNNMGSGLKLISQTLSKSNVTHLVKMPDVKTLNSTKNTHSPHSKAASTSSPK